ncbi:MAG TPA: hypothetical protein VMZ00_17070 [Sporichthya sp.]|nr:hypothetical protein [Sporichthya sp.]
MKKVKNPCPSAGAVPPGHDKGNGSGDRPCGKGKGGNGNKHDSGVIFVLPLLAATAAWSTRPERGRRRARGK